PRLGESETDEMLELLGPQAPHPLRLLAAQPADGGNNLLVTAVVAPQRSWCLMHREGDGAAGAGAHIAAGGTLQVRREAASVQEEDHLLAPSEGAAHGLVERHGPWYPVGVGYPRRSARHASARSPSDSPECNTATWSPNTPRTRATVCGVKAISGTSRIAPRPSSTTWRSTSRYTRVFPDPVTPWIRAGMSIGRAATA